MRSEALGVALGKRLRLLREQQGLRQEDVARVARTFGLDWTRATVAAIETGRRSVALEEFFLLPNLVVETKTIPGRRTLDSHEPSENAGDTKLWVPDFLPENGWVAVTSRCYLRGSSLRERLGGISTRKERTTEPAYIFIGERREDSLEMASEEENEAEQKAARKLDVEPLLLVFYAREAWGRGFTAERDRRVLEQAKGDATPRRLQALRGHVTRQLLKELESKIKAHGPPPKGRRRFIRAIRRALKRKNLTPEGRETLRRKLEQLSESQE
jgi:transcriptional regulator with XRE-family HTH domain